MKKNIRGLSRRATNALRKHGIAKYATLIKYTKADLRWRVAGLGPACVDEIVQHLDSVGLKLKEVTTTQTDLTDNEKTVLKYRGNLVSYMRIALLMNLSPTRIVQIEKSAKEKVAACQ